MRIGNLKTLSERDWSSIREFREFDRQEREKQRLVEDKEQYQHYVKTINADQERVPPRYKISPLDFDTWRSFTDATEADPILRGQVATNRALLKRVGEQEEQDAEKARKAIREGKPDEAFVLPASALGLNMSVQRAKEFVAAESERFVRENPEYEQFRSAETYEAIIRYLSAQTDLQIPNADCLRAAFNRLKSLGMLKETSIPELPPVQVEQPPDQIDPEEIKQRQREEYRTKIVITDPRTGEGLTAYQLDRVSADEYKRLMIGEFSTPTIVDVIRPTRSVQ